MGWLFGIIGNNIKDEDIAKINAFLPKPLYSYRSNNIYLISGGLKQTCLWSISHRNTKDRGWLVCGLGILRDCNTSWRFMSRADWDRILSKPTPTLDSYDGHFVVITWEGSDLSAYTDQLGLRDLYITEFNDNYIISTRLDWLCNYCNKNTLDLKRFGSRWFCPCQLSTDSIIHKVIRLGPKGSAKFSPMKYTLNRSQHNIPDVNLNIPIDELITQLATFPIDNGYHIRLLLSGGIDARVLLAALLSKPKKNWSVFMFGTLTNPDVKIALKIARKMHLNYQFREENLPSIDHCINWMSDFAAQTDCTAPVIDAIRLRFYYEIYRPNEVIIDGGFGEMGRIWLFNRLLLHGYTSFILRRIEDLVNYLTFPRANFFNRDTFKLMNQGIKEDISTLLKTLPYKNFQNFVDLVATCFFLPNMLSPEQSRIDNLILSFMPFAQPSYLKKILNMEIAQRKNGRLFRKFILRNSPYLTRFPLVTVLNDNIYYPYFLSNKILIKGLGIIEKSLGVSYHSQLQIEVLKGLKSLVFDMLSSQSTRDFKVYDFKIIEDAAVKFYKGECSHTDVLIWWLTFEMWRRALKITNYV